MEGQSKPPLEVVVVTYTYWEDFENVDQGFGVFVSPESDQSHLAQKNPVNPANTPDVITGSYSLKVRAGDYMRTLPSTVRLNPETEYTVGIDYKSPNANSFTFAVKSDKAKAAGDNENAVIASAVATDQKGSLELKFTTGNYDDYYIDVTAKNASEYYLDNLYVQAARQINRETLGVLIEEATALDEMAYTEDSYQKMMDVLKEAEEVQKDQNTSMDAIRQAYEELEKAMDELISFATQAEKEELQNVIVTLKSLLKSDYKQDEQWLTFETIIAEAETMLDLEKVTSPEIKNMIRDLYEAKDALNPIVDRTELKAIMKKAERVEKAAVVDGKELQTFLSSMENAKAIDLKPGVTESEITDVTNILTDAYNNIVLKEEYKKSYVIDALKETNVKETYFLEDDWKTIVEAKETLTAMKEQAEVKVKDYYEVFDELHAALENKLSRPIIPASVEIPSKGFTVTANTEETVSSEGRIEFAFDGNPDTLWHSQYTGSIFQVSESNPAQLTIDMGRIYRINQFSYLQRAAGGENGKIQKYNLYIKKTQQDDWNKVVADGTFENKQQVQKVEFDVAEAQYVMLEVTQGYGGFVSAAELAVYQKVSDFTALQQIMNQADKLNASDYTTESYAALLEVYSDAEKVMENLQTEQSVIDNIVIEMQKAMDSLAVLADSTSIKSLENAVKEAEKIELGNYKNTEAFEKALKEAKEVLKDIEEAKEVIKSEVTNAALKLIDEQDKLEPIETQEVNKSDLESLIIYAQDQKDSEEYDFVVPAVKTAFEEALTKAVEVNEKAATQAEVDAAYDKLLKMVHMLDFTGNNIALSKMVQQVQNLKKELYTTATWAVFEDARTKAQGVLDNENSLQAEIDAARVALRNAIFGLRLIPDKGQLEELIKTAEAVNTANYTVKSATAFAAALDNAKAVFADADATEEDVKAAEEALEEAQKNLVAKAGADKDVSDDGNSKQTDKSAAKTGDAGTALPAAVAGAALAILAALKKRR